MGTGRCRGDGRMWSASRDRFSNGVEDLCELMEVLGLAIGELVLAYSWSMMARP